jgi:pyridoxamine 5'-phosphate oxidase
LQSDTAGAAAAPGRRLETDMGHRLDNLDTIHQACWRELGDAAHGPAHPWRLMALATVAGPAEAQAAELRTVVLREVHVADRALLFFTDARSPKVTQLRSQPAASLMVWSQPLGWQLRLRVQLSVAISGLAVSSRWARLKMSPAAHDYLSPLPPGTPVAHPLPERGSREHFALVTAAVQQIDWLELHADGHRRALFDAAGQGQWLSP